MIIGAKRSREVSATLEEIHRYVDDIRSITILRNKTQDVKEKERYDTALTCMQEVLIHLNQTITIDPKKKQ